MISKRVRRTAAATLVLVVGSVATSQQGASAAGVGAVWNFNERTGPAVDSSGNGNHGQVHGRVVRTGSGYRFDGASGYVSVPNSPSLNPGTANVTISVKFSLAGNPTPAGASYDLVRKGLAGTAGGEYKLEILSGGRANCRFAGRGGKADVRGGRNLGVGTHIVRCVKTATSVSLYVDSRLTAVKAVRVGAVSNTKDVVLGAKPGDDFTNGLIDYIKIR